MYSTHLPLVLQVLVLLKTIYNYVTKGTHVWINSPHQLDLIHSFVLSVGHICVQIVLQTAHL